MEEKRELHGNEDKLTLLCFAHRSENNAHIFNSHCTFAVRHRKIEEKCLNQTQTLQQNKTKIYRID